MATKHPINGVPSDVSRRTESAPLQRPHPPCILVADDDTLMLELIEFKLTARGYSVLTASDGELALASALSYRPNLIVLSTKLPVLDGFEVLRRLRRDTRTGSIPIIMLTARRQERDALAALAVGAEDFLAKPFLPEELVARIGKLLTNRLRSAG
jgi:DNA-binding response OmpR family regulator